MGKEVWLWQTCAMGFLPLDLCEEERVLDMVLDWFDRHCKRPS